MPTSAMSEPVLQIRGLEVGYGKHQILRGVDLQLGAGEIHAIMGPNGSGKSTLSKVLAGHPAYEVTDGSVTFKGKNLLELEVDARARAGSVSTPSAPPTKLPPCCRFRRMK